MKKKTILLALAICFIASAIVNVWLYNQPPKVETKIETHTDTIYKDTIIHEPQPAETIKTGKVVYVDVPIHIRDSIEVVKTDTISVALPIEQTRYEDSLYTAWVSGYAAKLDSIALRIPTINTETIVTQTVKKKPPRLSIGAQVGGGVGVIYHKPDIYVGVGLQYRLWP